MSKDHLEVKTIALIYNPFGGKGAAKIAHTTVTQRLDKAKIEYKSFATERAGHAVDIARTEVYLDTCDAVASIGGDGTLHEVLNGLVLRYRDKNNVGKTMEEIDSVEMNPDEKLQIGIPVAVIPAGTGNDFAGEMGIGGGGRKKQVTRAIDTLLDGKLRSVDLGMVKMKKIDSEEKQVKYFHTLVGLGIGVDANIRAEKWRCCGPIRYDFSILLEIASINVKKGPKQSVVLTGVKGDEMSGKPETMTFDKGVGVMMIQNISRGAAGLKLAPSAQADDGFIDILFTDKLSSCQTLGLFKKVKANGKHVSDSRVMSRQCKRINFESETEKWVNLDGENCGKTPLEIVAKEKCLRIFTP